MAPPFRIAVIPGDGIGKEVMPEGVRVLDAAAKRFKLQLQYQHIEWASCDWYAKTGQMMPDDWRRQLEGSDALRRFLGEADPDGDLLRTPLAEIEKRHILRVLSSTGGNKTRAARILGIDTKTLYNKLKSYGAAAAAFRRRTSQRPSGVSR